MEIKITVPSLGESINEVEVGQWQKKVGQAVKKDQPIVDVESEKATLEIPSPQTGVLVKILKQTGEEAAIGEALAIIDTQAVPDNTADDAATDTATDNPADNHLEQTD